ncbi:MAG: LLM class F420-dependent oxidoreductase [Gammaproteobacteria bacterium]|nr:LLM class F420-dependent oxidoreductase [Gammaproteobacteria bacterium]
MKLGVFATFMSPNATPAMIADFARSAEQAGLESLWMGEHVVLFDEMEFPYPSSKDGKVPVPPGGGLLDTVATFGFIAAATHRIRLGTGVTLVPQRNPVYTAKEFATLDWLSGGRIDFGIGVGWCKEEVLACGYTFEDRGRRCDEFLQVMQRLWRDELAAFEGEHYTLAACRMDPKPVQPDGLPIIVGGHSRAGLRRAARHGSGWYGFNLDLQKTGALLADLDVELTRQGRDRTGFEIVITPPLKSDEQTLQGYAELGVDRLVLHLGSQRPERVDQRLGELQTLVTRLA